MDLVTEKKIITSSSEIWIESNGILFLIVKEDEEVDLAEATFCFKAYRELGVGPDNKVLQMIISPGSANITPEARKYAAEQGSNYFIASAVVSESLAVRLIVNFFNTFYRQPVPLKMFDTREAAMAWLLSFKK